MHFAASAEIFRRVHYIFCAEQCLVFNKLRAIPVRVTSKLFLVDFEGFRGYHIGPDRHQCGDNKQSKQSMRALVLTLLPSSSINMVQVEVLQEVRV